MIRHYEVRSLASEDRAVLATLDSLVNPSAKELLPSPAYRTWCVTQFPTTCLGVWADQTLIGYVLCLLRKRQAFCTTLAVQPAFQRTRATPLLVASLMHALVPRVDTCWLSVAPDNFAARTMHAMFAARVVGRSRSRRDYQLGDIVARSDRATLAARSARYQQMLKPVCAQTATALPNTAQPSRLRTTPEPTPTASTTQNAGTTQSVRAAPIIGTVARTAGNSPSAAPVPNRPRRLITPQMIAATLREISLRQAAPAVPRNVFGHDEPAGQRQMSCATRNR